MDIRSLYQIFEKTPIINTDSRIDGRGGLFFALTGPNFDGNKYAEEALKTNKYAIVDDPKIAVDKRYILVKNVLNTLQDLAQHHRDHFDIPIIAITGTNGKTTTKELIASILSKKYKTYSTQGNLNNHIGVPLSILGITAEHEFAVIEMGASALGDIALLCAIAKPNYGIITNIGKAHLETFKSFENIQRTKGELYQYLYNRNGVAFVNSDNELLEDLRPPRKTVHYGTSKFTHCQGIIHDNPIFVDFSWVSVGDMSSDQKKINWDNDNQHITTQLVGIHNFENSLAAVCVGDYFEIDDIQIKEAIESYTPQNNRSQYKKTETNELIIDCYNANPSSMKLAITNFNKIPSDNKVLILGEMLELGKFTQREHDVLAQLIEESGFRNVYLIGENFSDISQKEVNIYATLNDFMVYLKENPITNSTILIKGSRRVALENVIPFL
ncbi:MAG: UDP-N-acetylmuramoyl-tripeptide--D-alanyl-D-alanine ligase [Salinivirgaceae bacterium]|nr:UDP-N-acetylmuramoyl-tripeptide--D-alanyl-D-alanine ligase [Salinivirgaceae bacterium]